ncbi:hypothetical protein GM418_14880 [Maribellus comscasis]|uniref:Uncharacterized protein n=1 Tax=Maribellus comscasis TaxID=2681766 RepID=A0A6I6JPK3_9BACT|nr:hypothetical protein [Maribellus comscasis]QGY44906.1 hypothetical protein GM418_14880 [Maribellus comscasis]
MNENKLKEMWNKTENVFEISGYGSSSIEQFLSGRSRSTARGVRNIIIMDMVVKTLVVVTLGVDFILYYGTKNVTFVCIAGILLLAGLLFFQRRMLVHFNKIADHGQTTRDKLISMLTYLKTKFNLTLLAVSITYFFVFISGTLVYFYLVYGKVRPLDRVDIIVFTGFIILGIVFNFIANKVLIKYQIKHLELCLTDMNDDAMAIVSQNIETQKKQDRVNQFLLGIVLLIGFLLMVAVFKNVLG